MNLIYGYYFVPRLWPTIMTIPLLVLLCFLGNWQLERLDWKLGLISQLENHYSVPVASLPSFFSGTDVSVNEKNIDNWVYRHVTVSGRFLYLREMPLYSIGPNGRAGYDLFTPFMTHEGKYIIVNRGWVPEALKEQVLRPETIPAGEVQLTGVLRKSWKREKFAPENDVNRNLWYFGDLSSMAQAQLLDDVFPMFLYADNSAIKGAYPIGGRSRLKIVNNHLDYAMTWYGLAIVLFVIYLIFNIRKHD